jgi:general stress protein 26
MPQHDNNIGELAAVLSDLRVAMLTTVEADGSLRSRPMVIQESPFDGSLWFLTDVETAKVYEIEHERHVNLSSAHPDDQKYVSLSGTASIVRDPAKVKELWTPAHQAWFPRGVGDPKIALLRVAVTKAEYWNSQQNEVVQLTGFTRA